MFTLPTDGFSVNSWYMFAKLESRWIVRQDVTDLAAILAVPGPLHLKQHTNKVLA